MTQYKPGQKVRVRDEIITILKIYPKGHKNASLNHAYYHITFKDEYDLWREDILNELVNESKLILQQ